jgi:hypothetical protein
MFGPKIYELSLVKTYVSRWGMAEAVRELIQNALDSESPFVYEFAPDDESHTWALRLTSEFTKLSPQTLLLGATSKADSRDAIGSFGEGYKIALLVLTRLGYDVDMLNGDLLWKPRFRFNRHFGQELLVIEETALSNRQNKGLTFVVHGLSAADVDAVRASCIRMQDHIGAIKITTYGDILLERPGELYVGGLLICQTEMKFGYNIKPEFIRLERDRQTVASWDLKTVTRDMWFQTKEFDRIAQLIEAETPDVEYARYDCPEMVKEACYQLFRSQNPGALVAGSQTELKQMVERGLTKTVYVGGAMHHAISTSRSYLSETRTLVAVQKPAERLKQWLSENRKEMRGKSIEAFKDLIVEAQGWKA